MKNVMKWLLCIVLALSLAMSGIVLSTVANEPNTEDLLLYYSFDGENMYANSGSLGAAYDAYATAGDYYRPDGAVSNGVVDSYTGLGKAADLNAASSTWIQFPNKALVKAENDFTVSFWYNDTEEAVAGEKRVVDFIGNGIAFWLDFQVNNGTMRLNISDSAQAIHNIDLGISSKGWHMYTLTVERGETTDALKIYMDGVLVKTDSFKVYDYYGKYQADENAMDNYNGFGGSSFGSPLADGAIDEFRFYKVALTAEQVNALHPEEVKTPADNMLLYYNFDGENAYVNTGSLGADWNAYATAGDYYRPDGAVSNGTVDGAEGLGKAADLSAASGSWIQIPNKALVKAENDFTVSFWYNDTEEAVAGEKRVVDFIGNGVAFWLDFQVNGGTMRLNISDSAQAIHNIDLGISSSGWHMYTLTVERGETIDALKIYMDGVLVKTDSFKVYDYYGKYQADENAMDNYNGFGGSSFGSPLADGAIDEVRLYSDVLSMREVAKLYRDPYGLEDEVEPIEGLNTQAWSFPADQYGALMGEGPHGTNGDTIKATVDAGTSLTAMDFAEISGVNAVGNADWYVIKYTGVMVAEESGWYQLSSRKVDNGYVAYVAGQKVFDMAKHASWIDNGQVMYCGEKIYLEAGVKYSYEAYFVEQDGGDALNVKVLLADGTEKSFADAGIKFYANVEADEATLEIDNEAPALAATEENELYYNNFEGTPLFMDGDDSVQIGTDILAGKTDVTLEFVVKLVDANRGGITNHAGFAGIGTNADTNWVVMGYREHGAIKFGMRTVDAEVGAGDSGKTADNIFHSGIWYTIKYTFSATTVKAYINGAEVGSWDVTGQKTIGEIEGDFVFGKELKWNDPGFKGYVSEIRVTTPEDVSGGDEGGNNEPTYTYPEEEIIIATVNKNIDIGPSGDNYGMVFEDLAAGVYKVAYYMTIDSARDGAQMRISPRVGAYRCWIDWKTTEVLNGHVGVKTFMEENDTNKVILVNVIKVPENGLSIDAGFWQDDNAYVGTLDKVVLATDGYDFINETEYTWVDEKGYQSNDSNITFGEDSEQKLLAVEGDWVLSTRPEVDDNPGGDNTGDDNTGDDNTGDDNTGDDTTGDDTTGGDDNTGSDEGAGDSETEKPVTGDVASLLAILAAGAAAIGGLKLRRK